MGRYKEPFQLDSAAVCAKLDLSSDLYRDQLEIYNVVLEVLKPFDGKQISKRIATAIQKALPKNTVYYSAKEHSWVEVSIWGNDLPYDNAVRINLGYGAELVLEKVIESNLRYGLHAQRIENIAALRDTVPARVAKYNAAVEAYDKALLEMKDLGAGHAAALIDLV